MNTNLTKNKKITTDTKWGELVKELSFLDNPKSSPKYAKLQTMFRDALKVKKN